LASVTGGKEVAVVLPLGEGGDEVGGFGVDGLCCFIDEALDGEPGASIIRRSKGVAAPPTVGADSLVGCAKVDRVEVAVRPASLLP
jgi:hypothetical protein